MIAQNLNFPNLKHTNFKQKNSQVSSPSKPSVLAPLTNVLTQRNAVIEWVYRAQKTTGFSRSSLFLAIALLDKLLVNGLSLNDSNWQLLAGSVTLVVTKFNEVYPVTVKKLNALSVNRYTLDQFVETQAVILAKVGFNLSPEDPIYEELAELEHRLGNKSEETIKTIVQNPAVSFKLGSAALLVAVESLFTGVLMERKNDVRFTRESAQLRTQLQRLGARSPSFKRLVSPGRA